MSTVKPLRSRKRWWRRIVDALRAPPATKRLPTPEQMQALREKFAKTKPERGIHAH